jgi:uncharacterized membrane protein
VFTLDMADSSLRRAWWTFASGEVSPWLLLAVAMAVVSHGMAWVLAGRGAVENPAAKAASPILRGSAVVTPAGAILPMGGLVVIGTFAFFIATAMCLRGTTLTLAWVGGAAALVAMAGRGRRLAYVDCAAVAVFVTAIKWLTADGLAPVCERWARGGVMRPVINGVALAGVALIVLTLRIARHLSEQTRAIVPIGVGVIAFALLNFETLRTVDAMAGNFADLPMAKQAALSVLWGVTGLVAVIVGFAKGLRPLRYAALVLLGVTLAKIPLIDLAHVQPVYRILSFLAVGGLLLCVSFVYHRQAQRADANRANDI